MCKEFFDLTDRQLYDRCRYLGISWKNTGKVQQVFIMERDKTDKDRRRDKWEKKKKKKDKKNRDTQEYEE